MRSQRVAGCIVLVSLMVVAVPAAPVSATRCLYAAHANDGIVSVIDASRGAVIGTIPFFRPNRTEARPHSSEIYVTAAVPDPLVAGRMVTGLARLDPLTATVTQTFPLGPGDPYDITFAADGSFAAMTFFREFSRLSLFMPSDGLTTPVITAASPGAGTELFDVALSADGTTAWATVPFDNRVLEVDLGAGSIVASIPLPAEFRARRILLSPDGATAYVTAPPSVLHVPGASTEGPGRLVLIDTATATVRDVIPLPHAPEAIQLDADGAVAWITYPNAELLGAIDLEGGGQQTVPLAGAAIDFTRSPNGDSLYVIESTLTSDAIAVVDTASAAITGRIRIPQLPYGLSVIEVDGLCAAAPVPCPGDCDASGAVDVSELLAAVTISFDRYRLRRCLAADLGWDGRVDVADMTRAIGSALDGCSVAP